jgi:hypothetical protein
LVSEGKALVVSVQVSIELRSLAQRLEGAHGQKPAQNRSKVEADITAEVPTYPELVKVFEARVKQWRAQLPLDKLIGYDTRKAPRRGLTRYDPGGFRTHDLRIKSPLLYQLSYRVKKAASRYTARKRPRNITNLR